MEKDMEFAAYCFAFSTWLVTVAWLMRSRPAGWDYFAFLGFLALMCIGGALE